MRIKFWGVRGSVATPLMGDDVERKIEKALTLARPGDVSSEEAVKAFIKTLPLSVKGTYGGNTPCIHVETDIGDTIIIDCGTGMVNLGKELMTGEFGKGRGVASLLISHTHWDHISGIPFFAPLYVPGNRFNFYSPVAEIKKRLDLQQAKTHFPIDLDFMASNKEFYEIDQEEELILNETIVKNKQMPHPGNSFGYRIEDKGKVFVYTSDCEFNIDAISSIAEYNDFFANADILVFDTHYTFEESIARYDWGHSSASIAIDIAGKLNVKKLVLFHHNPA